jgi:hypothetical protein
LAWMQVPIIRLWSCGGLVMNRTLGTLV